MSQEHIHSLLSAPPHSGANEVSAVNQGQISGAEKALLGQYMWARDTSERQWGGPLSRT